MSLSIYQLKPRFQQLLRPVLHGLTQIGVTPNQVTVATCSLCIAYGALLAVWPGKSRLWLVLPLFLFFRMALNAIDGMLAKHTGRITQLGALLNETCDQVSDIALAIPFAMASAVHPGIAVAAIIAALMAEFAGVSAVLVGAPRRFDGPMGKSDRAFAYGLAALFIGLRAPAAWADGVLGLVAALSVVTAGVRLRAALRTCQPATR